MNDEELKPCPFCGAKPVLLPLDESDWWVECQNKKCPVTALADAEDKQEAINAWNTRAKDK